MNPIRMPPDDSNYPFYNKTRKERSWLQEFEDFFQNRNQLKTVGVLQYGRKIM